MVKLYAKSVIIFGQMVHERCVKKDTQGLLRVSAFLARIFMVQLNHFTKKKKKKPLLQEQDAFKKQIIRIVNMFINPRKMCGEVGFVSRVHLLFGDVRNVTTALKVVEDVREELQEIEDE